MKEVLRIVLADPHSPKLIQVSVNKIIVAVSTSAVVNDLLARVSGIDVILVQSQYYANNDGTEQE